MKRSVISAHPTIMVACNYLNCILWAFISIHATNSDPVEPILNVTCFFFRIGFVDLNRSRLFFFWCLSMMRSFSLHRPTRDSEDDEDDEKKGKGCTLQVLIDRFVCMRPWKVWVCVRGYFTILSEQKNVYIEISQIWNNCIILLIYWS